MLDAITSHLSPAHRNHADQSITACAGALFGTVAASSLGMAVGYMPFSASAPMMLLYGSLVPLSIILFLTSFSGGHTKLPVLASLQYTALFISAVFMFELTAISDVVTFAGKTISAHNFVGVRTIVAAVLAAGAFMAVTVLAAQTKVVARASELHQKAVQRFAAIDIYAKQRLAQDRRDLAAFDAKLRAAIDTEVELEVEEEVTAEQRSCA